MKKCPECGNPSYDGAPVCGNCGFKFPKPKVAPQKQESIFEEAPKEKKGSSNESKDKSTDESTVGILKNKKKIIAIIILITIIVIFGIVLTGSNNNINKNGGSPIQVSDLVEFSDNGFKFKYPGNWEQVTMNDSSHAGAIFFKNQNNTSIEYYNSTIDSSSLKDITQERISYALSNGDYIELVETITLDGRNASNIILENGDGDYTRYVSMFTDGNLYVFKISGDSINSITSEDINSMIKTADIA